MKKSFLNYYDRISEHKVMMRSRRVGSKQEIVRIYIMQRNRSETYNCHGAIKTPKVWSDRRAEIHDNNKTHWKYTTRSWGYFGQKESSEIHGNLILNYRDQISEQKEIMTLRRVDYAQQNVQMFLALMAKQIIHSKTHSHFWNKFYFFLIRLVSSRLWWYKDALAVHNMHWEYCGQRESSETYKRLGRIITQSLDQISRHKNMMRLRCVGSCQYTTNWYKILRETYKCHGEINTQ